MGAIASQFTSLTIVYSIVYSDSDQRKHQSSASLAFVRGIHPGPVNSPHKWPVTRKMFPFDDVIMTKYCHSRWSWLWSTIKMGFPRDLLRVSSTFQVISECCEGRFRLEVICNCIASKKRITTVFPWVYICSDDLQSLALIIYKLWWYGVPCFHQLHAVMIWSSPTSLHAMIIASTMSLLQWWSGVSCSQYLHAVMICSFLFSLSTCNDDLELIALIIYIWHLNVDKRQ